MHADLRAALERVERELAEYDRARDWYCSPGDLKTLTTALRRHLDAEAKPVDAARYRWFITNTYTTPELMDMIADLEIDAALTAALEQP